MTYQITIITQGLTFAIPGIDQRFCAIKDALDANEFKILLNEITFDSGASLEH